MHEITTMKSIAVLLTVFNRKEQTLQCLSNLFAQTIPNGYDLDVYLTNDGCTDGTPEAVSTQFPQIIIIMVMAICFGIEECMWHGREQQRRKTMIIIYG